MSLCLRDVVVFYHWIIWRCVVFAVSSCAMDHCCLSSHLLATSMHSHTRWCKLTENRKTHLKNCLKQASPPDSENNQHREGLDSCIESSLSAWLLKAGSPELVSSRCGKTSFVFESCVCLSFQFENTSHQNVCVVFAVSLCHGWKPLLALKHGRSLV